MSHRFEMIVDGIMEDLSKHPTEDIERCLRTMDGSTAAAERKVEGTVQQLCFLIDRRGLESLRTRSRPSFRWLFPWWTGNGKDDRRTAIDLRGGYRSFGVWTSRVLRQRRWQASVLACWPG